MSDELVYLKEGFFKFLVSVEELKEKKEKLIFISSIGISEELFEEFRQFLINHEINFCCDADYVYPLAEAFNLKTEFTMSEWFAIQAVSLEKNTGNPYFKKILKNKIEGINLANEKYNLMRTEAKSDNFKATDFSNIIKSIDHSIVVRSAIKISFNSDKYCEIYPMRIVYLEGVLCVVGEDIHDTSLCYFAVEDIFKTESSNKEFKINFSQLEVNDFISQLRMINGNEERLILKIYSPTDSDLLPKYHHLGNPFVTSNPEGDMIWAASIEMCEAVYQWLYDMRSQVEILDPGHIRKEFAYYCELKKENSSQKKAS